MEHQDLQSVLSATKQQIIEKPERFVLGETVDPQLQALLTNLIKVLYDEGERSLEKLKE
jgi:hypothetical protein